MCHVERIVSIKQEQNNNRNVGAPDQSLSSNDHITNILHWCILPAAEVQESALCTQFQFLYSQ